MEDATASPSTPLTTRGLAEGDLVFGRYRLVRVVGRGGMGVVWRAFDTRLEVDVALKFIPDLVRWDHAALEDIKAETRRARSLTHPNIVRIHDLVEDQDRAAISMEFIDGRTLAQLRLAADEQILRPEQLLPWLEELAAALDYAHIQMRMIHRDLKPANLMVTGEGHIKVTDFGIARGLADSITRVSTWSGGGTLLYMSPQQAMGEEPSPTDDIYAIGATLYELLTGRPPFHTGDIRSQLSSRKPDSLASKLKAQAKPVASAISDWEQTIATCLSKNPVERPATMGAVAATLIAASKPRPINSLMRRFHQARWLVVLRVASVMVCAALIAAYFSRKAPPVVVSAPPPRAATNDIKSKAALGVWNFAGDGKDASGNGITFSLNRATPMLDRFGRFDRALHLNGGTALVTDPSAIVAWDGSQPFAVAFWAKVESDGVDGCCLLGSPGLKVGDHAWQIDLQARRLNFSSGAIQILSGMDIVQAREPIQLRKWTHIVAQSDGKNLVLFINGRNVGMTVLGSRALLAARPQKTQLNVGFFDPLDPIKFSGGISELRIWKRALSESEISLLASPEAPLEFRLTRGSYLEQQDLTQIVRNEFGPNARIADWNDLRRWHADDIRDFVDRFGLTVDGANAFVLYNGNRNASPSRYYFIHRFDGNKPAYFLAHDELGEMTLALGSWHDLRSPILAERAFHITKTALKNPSPSEPMEYKIDQALDAEVMAVEWQNEVVRNAPPPAVRVDFVLKSGRILRAGLQGSAAGATRLSLGDWSKPELSRETLLVYDHLEYTVVVTR